MVRILVVDDDERARRLMGRLVECFGFELAGEAADGEQALLSVSCRPVDLILADLEMPGMDGMVLIRRLRDGGARIPIIVVSGRGEATTVANALRAGANAYLCKPVKADLLLETIGAVLGEPTVKPGVAGASPQRNGRRPGLERRACKGRQARVSSAPRLRV